MRIDLFAEWVGCARSIGARLSIIPFIDQPDVIKKILTHPRLWLHTAHDPHDGAVA